MKNISLIITLVCSFPTFCQSDLNGIWETGDENTKIEIALVEGKVTGTLKSTDNKKAEIGRVILKDLKQERGTWTGQIWAARRQRWFDVEITPAGDFLELEIDAGFRNKSVEWKKQQ